MSRSGFIWPKSITALRESSCRISKAHAVFHAIVENQIADGLEPVVRALERLMKQGLSRHDAVHAIASVVTDHLYESLHARQKDSADVSEARYNAAIERLTVKEWHRNHGK